MRPLRVAFLLSNLRTGGAEGQMLALAKRLPPDQFKVDMLSVIGAGPFDAEAESSGVTVRHLGSSHLSSSPLRAKLLGRTRKMMTYVEVARRERYDVVDAWLYPLDVFAVMTRSLTRTPVVVSGRRNLWAHYDLGPVGSMIDSVVARRTDAVVANSDAAAGFALRAHRVDSSKLRVIRNGVELIEPLSDVERAARRQAIGVHDDDLLIGCVAHHRPDKCHELLLDAFAALVRDRPRVRLILVGDGPMRPSIERRIAQLGIQDQVRVHGDSLDMRGMYGIFDLLVQTSRAEGLPNALLEGAAAGLPIVATAAGGSVEIVMDGKTGLLVPVDDLDALVTAMRRAVDDPGLREHLGSEARRHVETAFGMDRFVKEFGDLYEDLVARRGART